MALAVILAAQPAREFLQRPGGSVIRVLTWNVYRDSIFPPDTTTMSYDQLVKANLRTIDVMRDPQAGIHDHYPVVVDLVPRR